MNGSQWHNQEGNRAHGLVRENGARPQEMRGSENLCGFEEPQPWGTP